MILKNICQIIRDYMELPSGSVFLRNEKINQTKAQDFNITVGFMSVKPLGTTSRATESIETTETTMIGQVVVEIYGRTFDVIERKEEIIQALASITSREVQLSGGFMVAQCPSSFNDISGLDGAAIPYRFQAIFSVQFIKTKTRIIEYYDQFRNEVTNG